MADFREDPRAKRAVRRLRRPFADIAAFDAVVRSLVFDNPFGCRSYMTVRKKNHPPVEKVRELYTAKFVYVDRDGKRVGMGSETYNTVEGYHTGIASVISNMANIASHGGKVRHVPASDLFAVTLKCNDMAHGLFYLSLARDRVILSSYSNDTIRRKVGKWAGSLP